MPAKPAAPAHPEKLFHDGEPCFIETADESWVPGTVTSVENITNSNTGKRSHKYHCAVRADADLKIAGVPDTAIAEEKVHATVPDESELGAVDDLLHLTYLHESTLLHSVRQRYFRSVIYTRIGPIILALNPFDYTIPHYQEAEADKYMAQGVSALSGEGERLLPHAWTTAHQAYWMMRSFDRQQSIIVSGESGAGKTETAKIVAKYLGKVSHREAPPGTELSPIPMKVNQSSPILEAFGNAKTKRNDNSSRFGKFMKIHFASKTGGGTMTGAEIEVYLLEKSRVVFHSEGERSYHAFYQALAQDFAEKGNSSFVASASFAATPQNDAETAALDESEKKLLEHEDMHLREAVDSPEKIDGVDDLAEFEAVREAMGIVGISAVDQADSWRVCAGVLHLLNVAFAPSDDNESSVIPSSEKNDTKSQRALQHAADLWGVSSGKLREELLQTTMQVGSDTVVRLHKVERARDVRDALCKALYERLFLELVNIVNHSVGAPAAPENWIGLLDIFGFEHFKRNSFEQLCINLANETLQGHYNQIIFTRDMEECVEEGIDTASVVFQDNQPCIDMIRGKISLLSLLDQECALGKGTDVGFCQNVAQQFKAHPNFAVCKTDPSLFGVRHYAGEVTYSVDGFREKNMDTMKDALKQMVHDSSRKFVSKLLRVEDERKAKTVGQVFRQQLDGLMKVLYATNPHWIRCVKPHPAKAPRMFLGSEVMSQLCCAGVLETVRIRQMSFSVRFSFADFWKHYRVVVGGRMANVSAEQVKSGCGKIIAKQGFDSTVAQLGKTKVFLKSQAFQKVCREKERTRGVAKTTVVAYLRGRDSVVNTACRTHLKFVRHIEAFARLRASLEIRRGRQFDADTAAALAWLRSLRACESDEAAARAAIASDEAAQLAAAENGARGMLTVVFELMHERRVAAALADEDARRAAIKATYWREAAATQECCTVLAAEMAGRATIEARDVARFHADAASAAADLRRQHLAELRAIVEAQLAAAVDAEDDLRTAIAFEENAAAAFLFAAHRVNIQEKSARRVVYMRARTDYGRLTAGAAAERIALEASLECAMRAFVAEEEEQNRIFLMISADREQHAVAKMLLDRKKEMYLSRLEAEGAAKRRFVMRR